MTIPKRIELIQGSLHKMEQNEREMAEAKQYGGLHEKVQGMLSKLADQLDSVKLLVEHEELKPKSFPSAKKSKEVWQRLEERYAGQNREGLSKGRDFTTLCNRTKSLADEALSKVKEAWNSVRRERATGLPPQTLDEISSVPGQEEGVARIRKLVQEAREISIPSSTEEYDQFESLCKKLKLEVELLDHKDIPKSVLSFFRATNSSHGAPYNALSFEVIEWLEARGMIEHLRIRYVGT